MDSSLREDMALRIVRPQVALTLFGAAALTLSGFYFLHYPVPGFFARAGELLAAGAGVLLAAGAGGSLWRVLGGPSAKDPAEAFLFRVGAGLPVLSLGLLVLGVAGLFRPGPIGAFLSLSAALSTPEFLRLWKARREILSDAFEGWGPAAGGLALFALALALLCAFAPPSYYDSLVYHLALPAKYLQEGRVGFVPYNQYAHFPQNMEMLYGGFLALSDDVSAQVFNVFLAALAAVAVAVAGRRWSDGKTRWDLILLATAPCALFLSSETYVETAMAFATTLALLAAGKALEGGDPRWWVVSGVLGGFAAGAKYTGVLTPAILAAVALLWPRERPLRERALDAAAVGGVAFMLFLPWMAKNFFLTGGNPVFPFLPSLFPAKNVYLSAESARAYFQVLDEYKGSSALLTELFMMPFRALTQVTTFGGGYDVTGDLGWALPLLLLPLGLFLWRRGGLGKLLLAYVAAHVFLWASVRPVLRFLYPVFPAACLLAGGGFSRALASATPLLRRTMGFWAALFLLSNGVAFYGVERVRDPFPAALGWQSREEYLLRKIDGYSALLWCGDDENVPPDGRLLLIGDQRGYYCPRPYVAPMALLPTPLKDWADGCADGSALRRKLRAQGFTHLFFHRREAERLKGYHVLDLTPSGLRAWEDLLARGKEVRRDASVSIYDLRD